MLALATEGAIENLATVAGTPLPVVAHTFGPTDKSECVARIAQGAASACRRRARLVTRGYDAEIRPIRSEEHTSELQSLMRISYAVCCLKKTNRELRHRCQPSHRQPDYN